MLPINRKEQQNLSLVFLPGHWLLKSHVVCMAGGSVHRAPAQWLHNTQLTLRCTPVQATHKEFSAIEAHSILGCYTKAASPYLTEFGYWQQLCWHRGPQCSSSGRRMHCNTHLLLTQTWSIHLVCHEHKQAAVSLKERFILLCKTGDKTQESLHCSEPLASRCLRKQCYFEESLGNWRRKKNQPAHSITLSCSERGRRDSTKKNFTVQKNTFKAWVKLLGKWPQNITTELLSLLHPNGGMSDHTEAPWALCYIPQSTRAALGSSELQFRDQNKILNCWDRANWEKTSQPHFNT